MISYRIKKFILPALFGLILFMAFNGCRDNTTNTDYPKGTPFIRISNMDITPRVATVNDQIRWKGRLAIGLQFEEWANASTDWSIAINGEELNSGSVVDQQSCVDLCYLSLYETSAQTLANRFGTDTLESTITFTLNPPVEEEEPLTADTTLSFIIKEAESE